MQKNSSPGGSNSGNDADLLGTWTLYTITITNYTVGNVFSTHVYPGKPSTMTFKSDQSGSETLDGSAGAFTYTINGDSLVEAILSVLGNYFESGTIKTLSSNKLDVNYESATQEC